MAAPLAAGRAWGRLGARAPLFVAALLAPTLAAFALFSTDRSAWAQTPAATESGATYTSLRPVDGPALRARLVGVDAAGELTFDLSGKGEKKLAADDLVRYGHPADVGLKGSQSLVLFRDGGRLVGRLETMDRQRVQFDSYFFGPVSLPRGELAAIAFQGSSDPTLMAGFVRELLSGEAAADRLLLDNGDRLEGTAIGASYPMDGDPSAQRPTLEIEVAGAVVPLGGDGLRALRFADARRPGAAPKVWVGLRDGSLVAASGLTLSGNALGVTWRGEREPWRSTRREAVSFVQPLGGRVSYLSSLEPQRYRHVPFLSLERPYFADASALGLPLRAGGRNYLKGLGMFPAAALTYAVPAGSARFEADLAIDDAAGRAGSVTFQVLLDGKPHPTAPTLRGGDAPVPLSVEVSGAKTLTLLVVFADRGDALDYADWLDARLVK